MRERTSRWCQPSTRSSGLPSVSCPASGILLYLKADPNWNAELKLKAGSWSRMDCMYVDGGRRGSRTVGEWKGNR